MKTTAKFGFIVLLLVLATGASALPKCNDPVVLQKLTELDLEAAKAKFRNHSFAMLAFQVLMRSGDSKCVERWAGVKTHLPDISAFQQKMIAAMDAANITYSDEREDEVAGDIKYCSAKMRVVKPYACGTQTVDKSSTVKYSLQFTDTGDIYVKGISGGDFAPLPPGLE
jgi:hypothetical protein